MIALGLVVTVLFCQRQLSSSDPLLNLSVFKYKMFSMTTVVNIAITILMYADLILLPMYLQNGRGFTAFDKSITAHIDSTIKLIPTINKGFAPYLSNNFPVFYFVYLYTCSYNISTYWISLYHNAIKYSSFKCLT